MNIFFDLPEVHQRILLSQWLGVEELAQFDNAICNQKYRSEYLHLIQSPECIFPSFTTSHDELADQWVSKRRARFLKLVFSGTNDPCARKEVLELSAGTVRSVLIHTRSALENSTYTKSVMPTQNDLDIRLGDIFELIANICTDLREFTILGSDKNENEAGFRLHTWDPFIRMLQVNKMLSILRISDGGDIDIRALGAICQLPHLTELQLTFCSFTAPFSSLPKEAVSSSITTLEYFGDFAVAGLCHRLPNLTTLRGGGVFSQEDARALFSCCPLMSDVELACEVRLSDSTCLAMAHYWPNLTRLTLQFVEGIDTVCSEEALVLIIHHCPLLQYVNICNYDCDRVVCPFDSERLDSNGEEWDEVEEEKCDLRSDITGPGSHLQILRVDRLSAFALGIIVEQCKHLNLLAILHARVEVPIVQGFVTEHMRPAELALHHLASSSVKILHLQNFTALTDESVLSLCNLEELCIAHCAGSVNNAAIVSLASRCPALQALCIVDVWGITQDFVLPVLDMCPILSTLEFHAREPTHAREDPAIAMLKQTICKLYPKIDRLELHF